MTEINEYLWRILIVYSVRGVLGFINYWIIFDKFYDFRKKEVKNIWFGIAFYVLITLTYIPVRNYAPHSLGIVILVLYCVRIVPFLWSIYGRKSDVLMISLFYIIIVESVAQNLEYLFVDKMSLKGYFGFGNDIALIITEVMILCYLLLSLHISNKRQVKTHFTKLSIYEYVLLFLMDFLYALMQAEIYEKTVDGDFIRKLSVITFVILLAVFLHIITTREQQVSMNTMIGNLKEPMKQITASYIEMNEKNTELRRFRHDTKNLLLVLSSMLNEKKYDQAVKYIDKMQEMIESSQVKNFDTGNFIADMLLESKLKIAVENGIKMTFEGCIPANRIDDVNLVILISNLLDNALEANKQIDGEKLIEIQSILKKMFGYF